MGNPFPLARRPLFKAGSPYAVGVARRDMERRRLLWLNAHEGKIIPPVLPYGFTLPPGWWLEDATIPAIPPSGHPWYISGLPALPRAILRRGTPPPPKMPRYRSGRGQATDAVLIADGYDPAEFRPYTGTPEPSPWRYLLPILAGLAGLIAVAWYSSHWSGR